MTKVLITGCSNPNFWYAGDIGGSFLLNMAVEDINELVFVVGSTWAIKAQDCHIIEPWYEVAKQAEEQGVEVEFWGNEFHSWFTKDKSTPWHPLDIYRLKPLPEVAHYTWDDREGIRGKWFADKYGYEFPVTAISESKIKIGDSFYTWDEFHTHFTNLDGSKIGKSKL